MRETILVTKILLETVGLDVGFAHSTNEYKGDTDANQNFWNNGC